MYFLRYRRTATNLILSAGSLRNHPICLNPLQIMILNFSFVIPLRELYLINLYAPLISICPSYMNATLPHCHLNSILDAAGLKR